MTMAVELGDPTTTTTRVPSTEAGGRKMRRISLGTGSYPLNGRIAFTPSPNLCSSIISETSYKPRSVTPIPIPSQTPIFHRSSSLVRVTDLNIKDHDELCFHPPPPDVIREPSDKWIGLDTKDGVSCGPNAHIIIQSLSDAALSALNNDSMWTPDRKTDKAMKSNPNYKPSGEDVMVWTGKFTHGCYGHDLPAVKARGLIGMSARALTELLLDSDRTNEYNKMSLGRTDELKLSDDFTTDGPVGKGVTKVCRSRSKPPLIRKPLEFITLIHARKLEEEDGYGKGYLIVSRAVDSFEPTNDGTTLVSEILLNVNLIMEVDTNDGDGDQCEMMNINHIRSPMIPMMIAKKVGLTAAVNFFSDLRALC